MVGKQKKPCPCPQAAQANIHKKLYTMRKGQCSALGITWTQQRAPEGKDSWTESARMSEASQAHLDRWFHSQLVRPYPRILTMTLFSYLTFNLSEKHCLCCLQILSRIQNVCRASTSLFFKRKWRRHGGWGYIFIYTPLTHLYLQSEKINPKLPMRQETGYRGQG